MSQGGLDGLGLDQLALTLACWLSEVSSTLSWKPGFVRRSEPLSDCTGFVWDCVVSGGSGPVRTWMLHLMFSVSSGPSSPCVTLSTWATDRRWRRCSKL